MGANEESRTIRSVDRALEILHVIRKRGGAGVSEVASAVDMTPGSVHPYLASLQREGYLVQEGNEYHVGVRFLSLGGYARKRMELFRITRDLLDELARETGAVARLVVETNDYCITLYQVSSLDAGTTGTYEGFEEVMHSTAAGKAILANLPGERVREVLDERGLPARTPNTITDESELRAELDRIRSQGYAIDDEECFEGVLCVAGAIETPGGDLLGAVSVSNTTDRVDRDSFFSEVPDRINDVTGVIEIDYTYSNWD